MLCYNSGCPDAENPLSPVGLFQESEHEYPSQQAMKSVALSPAALSEGSVRQEERYGRTQEHQRADGLDEFTLSREDVHGVARQQEDRIGDRQTEQPREPGVAGRPSPH